MTKHFWNGISLGGTLGTGILAVGLAFFLDARFGWLVLIDLALITAVSNTYKVYRFKPRPDNPRGIRPERPFHPKEFWRFLSPKNVMDYFHYVDAGSFPSIHSARSFNQAALFAWYVDRADVAAALFLLAVLIAWSRVVKRRHFKTDITAGAVLGLAVAVISLWFFP